MLCSLDWPARALVLWPRHGASKRLYEALTTQSRVNFLFALAKAKEDAGDFDAAWRYYEQGNGEQRGEEYYDPVQTEVVKRVVSCADRTQSVSGFGPSM